eukprot:950076-Lingulodinium_polyedra.AAC.1
MPPLARSCARAAAGPTPPGPSCELIGARQLGQPSAFSCLCRPPRALPRPSPPLPDSGKTP